MAVESTPRRITAPGALLVAVAVLALVAYFLWSRRTPAEPGVAAPVATAPSSAAPVVSADGQLPPGVRNEDGILVDAEGRRVLNEAGLPIGPPIDPAKAIPVKAAPGEIVGYAKDANGVSKPLRAEDLRGRAANSPGTYAVVDMWADGGPTVVQATEGHHLSERELAAARASEARRDKAAQDH